MLNPKTAIILNSQFYTEGKNKDYFQHLVEQAPKGCEVIVVGQNLPEELVTKLEQHNTKFINVGGGNFSPTQDILRGYNMARNLIAEDTEQLYFLTNLEKEFEEENVDVRVYPIKVEPSCGAVGLMSMITSNEQEKYLKRRLINYISLSEENFDKLCRLNNGSLRHLDLDSMAVRVAAWDKIGGFALDSKYPELEFAIRMQALGYEIATQNGEDEETI